MREGITAKNCPGSWVCRLFVFGMLAIGSAQAGSFDSDVRLLLSGVSSGCHNEKLASGGLDVAALLDPSSIPAKRDGWERIVAS